MIQTNITTNGSVTTSVGASSVSITPVTQTATPTLFNVGPYQEFNGSPFQTKESDRQGNENDVGDGLLIGNGIVFSQESGKQQEQQQTNLLKLQQPGNGLQQQQPVRKEKKEVYKLIIPEIFKETYEKESEWKWKQSNTDITDYFNYGFCEVSFEAYSNKVRTWRGQFPVGESYEENKYGLNKMNDNIPLEYGGCSNPFDEGVLETPQNYNPFDKEKFIDAVLEHYLDSYSQITKKTDMIDFVQQRNILTKYVEKHDEEQQDNAFDELQEKGISRNYMNNLSQYAVSENYAEYKKERMKHFDFIALQQQILHNISEKNKLIHSNDSEKVYFLHEIFKNQVLKNDTGKQDSINNTQTSKRSINPIYMGQPNDMKAPTPFSLSMQYQIMQQYRNALYYPMLNPIMMPQMMAGMRNQIAMNNSMKQQQQQMYNNFAFNHENMNHKPREQFINTNYKQRPNEFQTNDTHRSRQGDAIRINFNSQSKRENKQGEEQQLNSSKPEGFEFHNSSYKPGYTKSNTVTVSSSNASGLNKHQKSEKETNISKQKNNCGQSQRNSLSRSPSKNIRNNNEVHSINQNKNTTSLKDRVQKKAKPQLSQKKSSSVSKNERGSPKRERNSRSRSHRSKNKDKKNIKRSASSHSSSSRKDSKKHHQHRQRSSEKEMNTSKYTSSTTNNQRRQLNIIPKSDKYQKLKDSENLRVKSPKRNEREESSHKNKEIIKYKVSERYDNTRESEKINQNSNQNKPKLSEKYEQTKVLKIRTTDSKNDKTKYEVNEQGKPLENSLTKGTQIKEVDDVKHFNTNKLNVGNVIAREQKRVVKEEKPEDRKHEMHPNFFQSYFSALQKDESSSKNRLRNQTSQRSDSPERSRSSSSSKKSSRYHHTNNNKNKK